jgi:hypothetical protein
MGAREIDIYGSADNNVAINAQPLEKVKLAAQRLTAWRTKAALAVHETDTMFRLKRAY